MTPTETIEEFPYVAEIEPAACSGEATFFASLHQLEVSAIVPASISLCCPGPLARISMLPKGSIKKEEAPFR
jgi:hypothetical protein